MGTNIISLMYKINFLLTWLHLKHISYCILHLLFIFSEPVVVCLFILGKLILLFYFFQVHIFRHIAYSQNKEPSGFLGPKKAAGYYK